MPIECVGRRECDDGCSHHHGRHRQNQGRLAPITIGETADNHRTQRTHEECDAECRQREQQGDFVVRNRKEQLGNCRCKEAVDGKIKPLESVADRCRNDGAPMRPSVFLGATAAVIAMSRTIPSCQCAVADRLLRRPCQNVRERNLINSRLQIVARAVSTIEQFHHTAQRHFTVAVSALRRSSLRLRKPKASHRNGLKYAGLA